MRMFNIKNKSAMRYVIKRETTGKVGPREHDHRITILRNFPTYDEALSALKERKAMFQGTRFNVKTLGPDRDYYAIFSTKALDCIDRYWIVEENPNPHLPWWLM